MSDERPPGFGILIDDGSIPSRVFVARPDAVVRLRTGCPRCAGRDGVVCSYCGASVAHPARHCHAVADALIACESCCSSVEDFKRAVRRDLGTSE